MHCRESYNNNTVNYCKLAIAIISTSEPANHSNRYISNALLFMALFLLDKSYYDLPPFYSHE
ncbi:MAG: hypothetical protein WCK96_12965 [Methylococcales bacterium]